jgi:putative endonuclease|tara:strand:+ start:479 stop:739 length:261 start_codon:yes stop_codon:yes gene_type:complete
VKYNVYILKSFNHDWHYVGMSSNVTKRFNAHNNKKVHSTKHFAPFKLILVESFPDRTTARRREKYYKTGFGKKVWMKKVSEQKNKS